MPGKRIAYTVLMGIGAVGMTVSLLLVGRISESKTPQVANGSDVQAQQWFGLDILDLLSRLSTLDGEDVTAGSELRLWVLIDERECPSCLAELPLLASLADSIKSHNFTAVVVALGDRHEIRRTLWGVETGMPTWMSSEKAAIRRICGCGTPLRVVTWHDRIVWLGKDRVFEDRAMQELLDVLRKWSTGKTRTSVA